jgi:hypothetical protein
MQLVATAIRTGLSKAVTDWDGRLFNSDWFLMEMYNVSTKAWHEVK